MRHFVLVHGIGHGAWCWYKLASLLKMAGHRVSTLDLGASGIDLKHLDEMESVFDYVKPLMELMESLSEKEKIIIVGHSFGGIAISLVMEKFPEKIDVAVYVAAVMPNNISPPGTIIQEGMENPPASLIFGSDYMESKMYKYCKSEDLTLAEMLLRPGGSLFIEDLMGNTLLTKDKYGSVNQVCILCDEDDVMNKEFQLWMIENNPVKAVKVIEGADHMAMLSRPHQLCLCLQEITETYIS